MDEDQQVRIEAWLEAIAVSLCRVEHQLKTGEPIERGDDVTKARKGFRDAIRSIRARGIARA